MNKQQNQNEAIPADEVYCEQVYAAGFALLSDLHDLTFHEGDGYSLRSEITSYGVAYVVENLRSLAQRVQTMAAAAIEDLHVAEAARAWMVSGRPLRCVTCGYDIDPELSDEWRICRAWPEHTYCHRGAVEDEDRRRAVVIEDDERVAYCEDRERSGGPFHGDEVELRFPDGRSEYGSWYVPGPPPLAAPVVLLSEKTASGWVDTEISPAGADVSVTALGEDLADYGPPSLDDLARGAQMAAALAGWDQRQDGDPAELQDVSEEDR